MILLPGQHGDDFLNIPTGWQVEVLSPRDVEVAASPTDLLLEALTHPIGCRPLAELVLPGQKVLVVCDDATRRTPVSLVLPTLLDSLTRTGCKPSDITFAIALGTHRSMTSAEIEHKLGRAVAVNFPVINDPAQKRAAFVPTGHTFAGVPVEVHRAVLEADFIIAIGSVAPHTEAGWSGGCKMILPGMCSERTVMANHRLASDYAGNALGQDSTPVRRNMEEIVAGIGLDFSINLVLAPDDRVAGVFAGHFVAAQRRAAEAARTIYAVPYRQAADIVISNAYPADIDFWQASKGIFSGQLMVKPGGTVILHAACPEGVGPHPDFLKFVQAAPAELEAGLTSRAFADVTAAALALPVARMLDHMHLAVVSPGLPSAAFCSGRVTRHSTLAGALHETPAGVLTTSNAPFSCRVGVLTHGGCTFPVPAVN